MRRVHDFLTAVRPGDHTLLLYETLEFKNKALFTYLKSALKRRITAVYISHKEPATEILRGMKSSGIEVERFARTGLFELWEITPDLHPTHDPPSSSQRPSAHHSMEADAMLKAYVEGKIVDKRVIFVADDPLHNVKPEAAVSFEKLQSSRLKHTPASLICTYSMKEVSRDRKLFLDLIETHQHIIIQTYGTIISSDDTKRTRTLVI